MASKIVSWTAVIFERDLVRTAGKIQLHLQEAEGVPSCAEVSFEGARLPRVVGTGQGDLAALIDALQLGTAALNAFRSAGGMVLHEVQGFGIEPFEKPLERFFRTTLERFGLEEERIDAEIVTRPTPTAIGDVCFTVRVGGRLVVIHASPSGVGFGQGEDLDAGNLGMRAVSRYLEEHRDEALSMYREASRLRRTAGNPPPHSLATAPHITVAGRPTPHPRFVEFAIQGAPVGLRVLVFSAGAIVDDCDDWVALPRADREAAIAAVFHYVFANREEATTFGLDVDLLEEALSVASH